MCVFCYILHIYLNIFRTFVEDNLLKQYIKYQNQNFTTPARNIKIFVLHFYLIIHRKVTFLFTMSFGNNNHYTEYNYIKTRVIHYFSNLMFYLIHLNA